jgi:hypothetical protein
MQCGRAFANHESQGQQAPGPDHVLVTRFIKQLDLTETTATRFLGKAAGTLGEGDDDFLLDVKLAVQNSIDAYDVFDELLLADRHFQGMVHSIKSMEHLFCQKVAFHLLAGNPQECIDLTQISLQEVGSNWRLALDRLRQEGHISANQ